ncbi:MAG TPA: class I SAM-dependent methyltransferase [Chitinophagaceae bacterium]|nr:class I SAM-dependent methyltransferase [Chitinophagaceae bacterium]
MSGEEKIKMFSNRLTKVFRHLSKQARRQGISCYRIYDRDLPEFPLIIDVYEDKIYLSEYRAKHSLTEEQYEAWLNESLQVIATVTQVPDENIYLKQRKRKTGRQDQYQKTGEEMEFFTVKEAGLQFKVNLSDYLDTGLFLDHRITRNMLREQSTGKKVLNLFCYTASFSVYAAAGGAASVVSVDLSKTYLSWAEDNFKLNALENDAKYHFVHADVLQYLDEPEPDSFDIIILDPPTFSNSKRMKDFLDIQQDHADLINKCLLIMKPGGTLYFSTNYTKFQLAEEKITSSLITDITKLTTPFDFEGKLRRWCFKIIK